MFAGLTADTNSCSTYSALTRLCWSLVFVEHYFICGKLATIHHTWGSTVLNIGKCLIWWFPVLKQRCFYCLYCCSFKPWSTMQDKSMLRFWSSLFAAIFITSALLNQSYNWMMHVCLFFLVKMTEYFVLCLTCLFSYLVLSCFSRTIMQAFLDEKQNDFTLFSEKNLNI